MQRGPRKGFLFSGGRMQHLCARAYFLWVPHVPFSCYLPQGWSSFTTGASKFASAAKEGVSS